jgi:hypothetical protein
VAEIVAEEAGTVEEVAETVVEAGTVEEVGNMTMVEVDA